MVLRRVWFYLPVLFALMAFSAMAQEFRGTINGRVTDQSGAGLADAKVTVKNAARNEETNVTTTSNGDYTVPFLIPGTYSVTVTAKGFKEETHDDVEVRVSEKISSNFQMQLGAVTESVTVSGAAPLVDQTTADRGEILDNTRVTQLPVIGRNPINFVNLAPGVVFNGNPQFQRPFDN
ncbi:MAG TPA: carboxypeptidase-like regulatory domain-containing protein, partial [Bryobacteraceae bacterium]|nr:carboxypeptidase-like regulatory domain-containing protein [Bryobacteraceae bacterium]